MKVLLSAIFIISMFVLSAQNSHPKYPFENIATENVKVERGLSQNTVFSIVQDNYGYLWIGTWDGLNKFNGYDFTIYSKGTAGLSNATINSLFIDSKGKLWVGTDEGINILNDKTLQFDVYKHDPMNISSLSNDTILCIQEDQYGDFWIGTNNGLNKFFINTGTALRYNHMKDDTNSLTGNIIFDVIQDKDGIIWIATDKGLNMFNPHNNLFANFQGKEALLNGKICSIYIDEQDILWIGTEKGLLEYSGDMETLKKYTNTNDSTGLSNNNVCDIIEDEDNNLWIATNGGGVDMLDRKTNRFYHYNSSNVNISEGKKFDDFLNCLYEDKSGIIWMGTYGQGLTYINKNQNKFTLYKTGSVSGDNTPSNNVIWGIARDNKGRIYFSTDHGINIMDRKQELTHVLLNNPHDPNSLPSNKVRSLWFDEDSLLWVGTFDQGVAVYNPKTGKFQPMFNQENGNNLINNIVWSIVSDSYGYVWLGTNYGLFRYNKKTKELKSYYHNGKGSISSNEIYNLTVDREKNLWISTNNGLNKYNYKTDKFMALYHDENNNSLSISKVFSVYQASDGIYWIATVGGGLNRYDAHTGKFKHYNEKDGLYNNVVYAILEDEVNHLWISTNQGIFQFDPYTETFINYDVDDGLQSNEFNLNSFYKTQNGEMFFGGMKGLNSFYPSEISKNEYIPPVVISNVKVFNKSLDKQFINNDTLVLNYNDNYLAIEFSALDFTSPLKNKYSYKMEGVDKDWVNCDANKRYAEYTNLVPGNYKFYIKGSNNAGVWNNEGACLYIQIVPPWWSTIIFRIIAVLVLALIIFSVVYSGIKRIQRKHNVEKQILELQKKSLRLQMNPHFIFNTLNAIQYFILKNDKLASNKYLTMFSKLMRKILDNSDKKTITIREELETLKLYIELEQLRFDGKFDYEIQLDSDHINEEYIPSMILQPYIENSIIHGLVHKEEGKGILFIELKREHKQILCIIEDNGIGREKAMEMRNMSKHKHRPMGKHITQSRLELINTINKKEIDLQIEDLKDEADNPIGTRVRFKIPIIT